MSGIEVQIRALTDRFEGSYGRLPETLRAEMRPEIMALTKTLMQRTRYRLSGPVLHVRSGRLIGSIKARLIENPTSLFGKVFSEGVPYAAIHEHGGRTKPHLIEARNANALSFFWAKLGRQFIGRSVNHPGSVMPERSYLRSSLSEMQVDIMLRLEAAAARAAQRASA